MNELMEASNGFHDIELLSSEEEKEEEPEDGEMVQIIIDNSEQYHS